MLLSNELLTTVVFMGGSGRLSGTAFLVSVPAAEDVNATHVYLVTASHCVWDWSQDAPRTDLFIRVNDHAKAGGIRDVPVPDGNKWFRHPEPAPTVDIAVLPLEGNAVGFLQLGYHWAPSSMFFSEDAFGDDVDSGVGLSDEVVTLGLFSNHSGKKRNEPIVRAGTIAMMPREAVNVNPTMGQMELYLVELRSIAGMSGSPVFVPHRSQLGAPSHPVSVFGVLLGHYPVQPADIVGAAINSGIGMVAPARMLKEVLEQDALVKRREQQEQILREQQQAGEMDSDSPQESGES